MSKNSFQNIQAFFYHQSNNQPQSMHPFLKDEEVSTHPTSKSNKLLKNRISAQNSRLRKKKYIEQLQKNQKLLIQQLQQTQKEIQKAKEQLNLILTKSKQNDSFNHDEKPTYERLKYLLRSQENLDEDEANMLIQLLINRVGVTCKQRKRMLDYYTKRLVNYSITAIYRYILQTSKENKGLLSKSNESLYDWDKQLYQKLELSQNQKLKLIDLKETVSHQREIWTDKINKFNQVRGQIAKISANVQKQIMTLKNQFNTRQTAQIIISIENRKYNQQISLQRDQDPFPKKKRKF